MLKPGLTAKRICVLIWLATPIICLTIYLYDPHSFATESIVAFLRRFENEILILYIVISIARGFTLLPSTPLVIAGTIIYPESPVSVLFISIVGILLSSSMIYFFSDFLGFSEFFENKRPEYTKKMRLQLEKPWGLLFVFLWAFFPFVPTDAVCYIAGTVGMKFWKSILAIGLGELILCSFYVFSGHYVFHILN